MFECGTSVRVVVFLESQPFLVVLAAGLGLRPALLVKKRFCRSWDQVQSMRGERRGCSCGLELFGDYSWSTIVRLSYFLTVSMRC